MSGRGSSPITASATLNCHILEADMMGLCTFFLGRIACFPRSSTVFAHQIYDPFKHEIVEDVPDINASLFSLFFFSIGNCNVL